MNYEFIIAKKLTETKVKICTFLCCLELANAYQHTRKNIKYCDFTYFLVPVKFTKIITTFLRPTFQLMYYKTKYIITYNF